MSVTATLAPASSRKQEIISRYLQHLDQHVQDLRAGTAEFPLQIKHLADALHLHPRHLSNTIHEVLGCSPCAIYEEKLLDLSKELLLKQKGSIAQIARHLLYDPSNFGKFFKQYTGLTPGQFRKAHAKN